MHLPTEVGRRGFAGAGFSIADFQLPIANFRFPISNLEKDGRR
jgi:hypothetical protein